MSPGNDPGVRVLENGLTATIYDCLTILYLCSYTCQKGVVIYTKKQSVIHHLTKTKVHYIILPVV